jgi:hypothetical protein
MVSKKDGAVILRCTIRHVSTWMQAMEEQNLYVDPVPLLCLQQPRQCKYNGCTHNMINGGYIYLIARATTIPKYWNKGPCPFAPHNRWQGYNNVLDEISKPRPTTKLLKPDGRPWRYQETAYHEVCAVLWRYLPPCGTMFDPMTGNVFEFLYFHCCVLANKRCFV